LDNLVFINKLDTYITFLGNKDTTYIETHLKNYNLLVQPSRIEGFGLTVTEAMAAKVPVLVSGQEGPMEIIANGQFGYYFKNENVEELADKIQEIMNKEIIEIKNLTEKAYQRVQECYNIKNTALKYLLEYRKED
jgi:glycosyltransferase involved in cell wall biosynthesis